MKPKDLQKAFLRLCRDYAKATDAFGTEEAHEKKLCTFSLIYRNAKIQLVYRLRETVGTPPSTLYCRIYPDKNLPIFLHLPDLYPLMEKYDFRAMYFPYIETAKRMAACFHALTAILEELRCEVDSWGATGYDREVLQRFLLGIGITDASPEEIMESGSLAQLGFVRLQEMQDSGYVARFTEWKPWKLYLMGQTEKALAIYRKRKDLLPFELQLCGFLQTEAGKQFSPMPDACFAQRDMQSVTVGKDDAGVLLKGLLILYPTFSALGCLLMVLIQWILSLGTVCCFCAPWYMGFILAGIPTLFGSIAFRRKLIPIGSQTAEARLAFDDILNSAPWIDKLTKTIFWVTTVAMLVFALVSAQGCLRLYPAYGSMGVLPEETFSYDQIDTVYHIDARYNDYGERVPFGSYVIVMEDGTQIDFYGITSEKDTEAYALPLFQELGIPLVEVDSDRDLPS